MSHIVKLFEKRGIMGIFDESGVTIYFDSRDNLGLNIDEDLVGGLFSAIGIYAEEVFREDYKYTSYTFRIDENNFLVLYIFKKKSKILDRNLLFVLGFSETISIADVEVTLKTFVERVLLEIESDPEIIKRIKQQRAPIIKAIKNIEENIIKEMTLTSSEEPAFDLKEINIENADLLSKGRLSWIVDERKDKVIIEITLKTRSKHVEMLDKKRVLLKIHGDNVFFSKNQMDLSQARKITLIDSKTMEIRLNEFLLEIKETGTIKIKKEVDLILDATKDNINFKISVEEWNEKLSNWNIITSPPIMLLIYPSCKTRLKNEFSARLQQISNMLLDENILKYNKLRVQEHIMALLKNTYFKDVIEEDLRLGLKFFSLLPLIARNFMNIKERKILHEILGQFKKYSENRLYIVNDEFRMNFMEVASEIISFAKNMEDLDLILNAINTCNQVLELLYPRIDHDLLQFCLDSISSSSKHLSPSKLNELLRHVIDLVLKFLETNMSREIIRSSLITITNLIAISHANVDETKKIVSTSLKFLDFIVEIHFRPFI